MTTMAAVGDRKKLLWIGDAGVPSGFALATHKILDVLKETYDVTVLGINYRGDPHDYPYPIYCAAVEGDWMGVNRLPWMCDRFTPDVIVVQQDGWNVPQYVKMLRKYKDFKHIPVVAMVAVDGKNFQGGWLNGVAHTIFWTKFALDEARTGGFDGIASVIPLGVDLEAYHQMDKYEARQQRLPREYDDMFIIGNVNRNQPRKRWDLTIKYFAEWIKRYKIDDAYLYFHTAPTGDTGVDLHNMSRYYGILEKVLVIEPQMWYGISEDLMRATYNCFDVQMSTTQGEGFGLTTLEGMACGVPQIVPDWSALGELCKDAAWLVPCTSTAIGPPYVNVIGGVADEEQFILGLQGLYVNQQWRETNRQAGFERVNQARFRWENVGKAFDKVLQQALVPQEEVVEHTV